MQRTKDALRRFPDRSRYLVLVLVSIGLLLGGCVYIPPVSDQVRRDDLVPVKIGVSTKSEVLDVLGKPNIRERDDVYIWHWWTHKGYVIGYLPGGGTALGVRRHQAFAKLDSNDLLTEYVTDSTPFLPRHNTKKLNERAKQLNIELLVPENKMGLEEFAHRIAFSPDGCRIATSVKRSSSINVWDISKGMLLGVLNKNNRSIFGISDVTGISFSPNGKYLVAGTIDDKLVMWDVDSGSLVYGVEDGGRVTSVAVSSDGNFVAAGEYSSGDTILYEADSGVEIRRQTTGLIPAWVAVDFHPTREILASFSGTTVDLLETATGSVVSSIQLNKREDNDFSYRGNIQFSPDGEYLAISTCAHVELWRLRTSSNTVELGDIQFVTLLPHYADNDSECRESIAFSPDSSSLFIGANSAIMHFDLTTGKRLAIYEIPGPREVLPNNFISRSNIAISPDGKFLARSAPNDTGMLGKLRLDQTGYIGLFRLPNGK